MSQGSFPDFHPVLVGAGCLALGYVYGRRCRASSEIPLDEPAATDQDTCCAQSQSNTYLEDLERCKCCMSAPAELDTGKKKGSKFSTRSPYMIQDATEGFEQAERSAKRDLEYRNSVDLYGRHMDKIVCKEGEVHAIRQHPSSPYFEKSYQRISKSMTNTLSGLPAKALEEERVLQAKTPYKKQKGTSPAVKESFCSKGKAEMGREDDDEAVESVLWSQEILNRRIDYFNNARLGAETSDTGRSDESRKLRHFKKNFLRARAVEGEATYNSCVSTSSHKSGGAERSTCHGLVPLATPGNVDCSHDDNIPRVFGGGVPQPVQGSTLQLQVSEEAGPETFRIIGRLHTGNSNLKERSKDAAVTIAEKEVLYKLELSSLQAEVRQTDPSPPQIPEDDRG